MNTRAISFRQRLEGEFRTSFYASASKIKADSNTDVIESLISAEMLWGGRDSPPNQIQRKRHKAVWMLLRDLLRASWKAAFTDGVLELRLPVLDESRETDIPKKKERLRQWMQESRFERLQGFGPFIAFMETGNGTRKSVLGLVADGQDLAERLRRCERIEHEPHKFNKRSQGSHGSWLINPPVQPYLQLVRENERDEFTNHKLSDIWRYFRLTWSTPAETTPGRTMLYLIRDAAHHDHAVMGIL